MRKFSSSWFSLVLALGLAAGWGGCKKKESGGAEAESEAEDTAGGSAGSAAAPAGDETPDEGSGSACDIEAIPFEAGEAGAGRMALAIAPDDTDGDYVASGVGVLSLADADWLHHETTPHTQEKDLFLSQSGRYLGYLASHREEGAHRVRTGVSAIVVDLEEGAKETFEFPEDSANWRLYGVTDEGDPAVSFGRIGDFDGGDYQRVTGFVRDGELTELASSVHGYQDSSGGALSADGRTIAIYTSSEGNEFAVQVLREGGEARVVFEQPGDVQNKIHRPPHLSADGSRLVFETYKAKSDPPDVRGITYAIDVESGEVVEHKDLTSARIAPDGSRIAGHARYDGGLSAVVRPFEEPGEQTLVEVEGQPFNYAPMAWSADGERLLIADTEKLYSVPVGGGAPAVLSACNHHDGPRRFEPSWASAP